MMEAATKHHFFLLGGTAWGGYWSGWNVKCLHQPKRKYKDGQDEDASWWFVSHVFSMTLDR